MGHLQRYASNRVVCGEGADPDFTGILVSGYLRLQRYGMDGRRQILCLLTPGDILGGQKSRGPSYSVEASTDALICRFETKNLDRIMAEDADLRRAVYALHSGKLEQLRWLTWSLGALSVEERLCAFLAVATKYMPYQTLGNGGVLSVDLPRADIADLLGTSVESISRITNRLDGEGIISIRSARQFEIRDLDRLIVLGCLQGTFENIHFPRSFVQAEGSPFQPSGVLERMSRPSAPSKKRINVLSGMKDGISDQAGSKAY
ncbi:MAG: Crp/Fnr family transcriptional regulator [Paracoccaceae bacterium]